MLISLHSALHLLQNATVAEAAVTPGQSLTVAFERKMRGTGDDCARQVVAFMDFSVNCFGFLSDFLSDPGFPGVRSMGPDVRQSVQEVLQT